MMMSLQAQIIEIREKLNRHEFANESAVSLGVVVHLLHTMGWPTHESGNVCPEYKVPGGWVDFALCVTPNEPVIFIEVKQPGKIDGADKQLFEYAFRAAFHGSVDVAIATDGREWRFYWPSGGGNYEQRRFCVVDFVEHDVETAAANLQRYLSWENVRSNQALQNAKDDYEELCNKRKARKHIPDACAKLLAENRDAVVRAVSEKVEALCGHMPSKDLVIEYLSSLTPKAQPISSGNRGQSSQQKAGPTVLKVTFPDGEVICRATATGTFIESLRKVGFEKAAALGLKKGEHPLISTQQHKPNWKDTRDGFFVRAPGATEGKKKLLVKVSSKLNLRLRVETINKLN